MTRRPRRDDPDGLLAWADGRLDGQPERRARVEAELAAAPALAEALRRDRELVEQVRAAYDGVLDGPVPPRLLNPFRRPAVTPSLRPALLAAAIAGAFAAGLLIGQGMLPFAPRPAPPLASGDVAQMPAEASAVGAGTVLAPAPPSLADGDAGTPATLRLPRLPPELAGPADRPL